VAGFGLNLQFCNHMTYFTGHSFEQYYQSTRRCWRFGQEKEVTSDIITTKGCISVLKNLQRKAKQSEVLFKELIANMNSEFRPKEKEINKSEIKMPAWIN